MVFNILNILVVIFIVVVGIFFVDMRNWIEGKGFFLYGVLGVLSGVVICFYVYVGFDIIVMIGEEVKNVLKLIFVVIVVLLVVIFICYFGVFVVVILMILYD